MKLFVFFMAAMWLVPLSVFAKDRKPHWLDMRAVKGLSTEGSGYLTTETVITGAIDATPGGSGKMAMATAKAVTSDITELSYAGLLKKNNLNIPTSAQIREAYHVSGRGSHRASTHLLYWDDAGRELYTQACIKANPHLSPDFIRNQVDDAAKRIMKITEVMYADMLRGTDKAADLAPRLAKLDILTHYIGDYTTTNTMGLPALEQLGEEVLRQVDGIWSKDLCDDFRRIVTEMLQAKKPPREIAETMLRRMADNGERVAASMSEAAAGRAFRKLSVNKTKALVRRVAWMCDQEARLKALKYLGREQRVNTLARNALMCIGPRVSYKAPRLFVLLDECKLIDKYMTRGLDEKDLATLKKCLTDKGVPENVQRRFFDHPEVKQGVPGKECVAKRLSEPGAARRYARASSVRAGSSVLFQMHEVSGAIEKSRIVTRNGISRLRINGSTLKSARMTVIVCETDDVARELRKQLNRKLEGGRDFGKTIVLSKKWATRIKFAGRTAGRVFAIVGGAAEALQILEAGGTAVKLRGDAFSNPADRLNADLNVSRSALKSVAVVSAGWAGAGGGAALGGIIGSVICPGIGTFVGATIGGAVGGMVGGAVAENAVDATYGRMQKARVELYRQALNAGKATEEAHVYRECAQKEITRLLLGIQ